MSQQVASVADLFRRAQEIQRGNPQTSYKEIKDQLVREYKGQDFPPLYNLTIPELQSDDS